MGIEPTLPAWKAGTLPLSYTRVFARRGDPVPIRPIAALSVERVFARVVSVEGRPFYLFSELYPLVAPIEPPFEPDPTQSQSTWVEQDSNLRRHCHQIYSLAPLAAWVSTRMSPAPPYIAGEEPETTR